MKAIKQELETMRGSLPCFETTYPCVVFVECYILIAHLAKVYHSRPVNHHTFLILPLRMVGRVKMQYSASTYSSLRDYHKRWKLSHEGE